MYHIATCSNKNCVKHDKCLRFLDTKEENKEVDFRILCNKDNGYTYYWEVEKK
ncbi:hypothetical protein [Methanobrevibacter sp. UBA417]|mgnify:CR=1 FL=1|jgi:hypothetical protein|uniref:hypothetical protein n=1 Tax=Methanobrevibacter sp. UBA417 TaxID=1915487 RepID=UPI0039B8AEA9